jgi:hypothetical protein
MNDQGRYDIKDTPLSCGYLFQMLAFGEQIQSSLCLTLAVACMIWFYRTAPNCMHEHCTVNLRDHGSESLS